ncbi:MAG TPA: response regulator [Terriglobales bacterium]|nr:response regulator [Terriglobales bacterium]
MKRRILLVDDELAILLTLKAILEMHGFEVETAASAKEAEQKLDRSNYHMVITDMKMEKDTAGYDVIRAARRQKYNPATAILTAYPTLGTDWRSQGAQSLLVKPVGTEDLLRQIEALLIQHEDEKQKRETKNSVEAGAAPSSSRARSSVRKAG